MSIILLSVIVHNIKFAGPTAHGVLDPKQRPPVLDYLRWGVYPPYPPATVFGPRLPAQSLLCLPLRPLAPRRWTLGPPGAPPGAPGTPPGPLGPHPATPRDPLVSSLLDGALRSLRDDFFKTPQWRKDNKTQWFFAILGALRLSKGGPWKKKTAPGPPAGPPRLNGLPPNGPRAPPREVARAPRGPPGPPRGP